MHVSQIDIPSRVSNHRVNWSMANCKSLFNYCCVLSDTVCAFKLPVEMLCTDLFYSNSAQRSSLNEYCNIISIIEAGSITIPSCTKNQNSVGPGWKNYIQTLRVKIIVLEPHLDRGRYPWSSCPCVNCA